MALSPKQQRFVEEYMIDCNGKQAVIRAGYAESGASVQAVRLLANDSVKAEIDARRAEQASRLQVDAEWVLDRLKAISDRCMQAEEVKDAKGIPTGEFKFDAAGANRATELLGKHLGLFADKVQHEGSVTMVVKHAVPDNPEVE